MLRRQYKYVGPPEILITSRSSRSGSLIETVSALANWLDSELGESNPDGSITATYVIDTRVSLLLAPRRSEHVACAAAAPVLSAGEITFTSAFEVSEVSNQSTGYCPEPESWPWVAQALDRIPVSHPGVFTTQVVFRLCPKCCQRNLVKDNWFVCELCGAALPECWNFSVNPNESQPRR